MQTKTPAGLNPKAISATIANLLAILDDAAHLSPVERLKINRELGALAAEVAGGVPIARRIGINKRLGELSRMLGASLAAATAPAAPTEEPATAAQNPADLGELPAESDVIAEGFGERTSSADVYAFDEERKQSQRQRDNNAATALLEQIDRGEVQPPLSVEQRALLARYSGLGGNLKGADGTKGSGYEYYTPKPIAAGAWSLLAELGFAGGRVLDPCAGVGIFSATAPTNAAIDAVELSPVSGRINQLVNDGPGHRTTISPFEAVAAATPDEIYDAVVTNVPFGKDVDARGGNQLKDPKYQRQPMEAYFILRSIEKLRPGGLAAFIVPARVVSEIGGKMAELRERVSFMAEFMGAYRMPNTVFESTSADTITDLIVFRKFAKPVALKIAELREQNPALLSQANVLWGEFLSGKYFVGEGRRFVLGEFVPKDSTKVRDVDRVISSNSVADVAKLLRKFGGSRINWELLSAAETAPIVYSEGDTIAHAGQTLQLQGGRWVALGNAAAATGDAGGIATIDDFATPLSAVEARATYEGAQAAQKAMLQSGRELDVPTWLRAALSGLQGVPAAQRELAWTIGVTGMAVFQALDQQPPGEDGFNYHDAFPVLSAQMARYSTDAKAPPKGMVGDIKASTKALLAHHSKAKGFSDVWMGRVVKQEDTRDTDAKFAAARYEAGGDGFVSLKQARDLMGADFDPHTSDDWCISADGQSVARADDYYVGSFAEFTERIDAQIAAAPSADIRAKLLRQKLVAEDRVQRADYTAIEYSLTTPFATIEEKAQFLRTFFDDGFVAGLSDKNERGLQILYEGKIETEKHKLYRRLAVHLNGGSVSLGGADFVDPKKAITELRGMVKRAQSQFNTWARANPTIQQRMAERLNDPARLYFRQADDDSELKVPGVKRKPHGYQSAFIRRMGREFTGINGDGVGLGKTLQGLVSVQHAHNIGTKRRTVFVVPNSVVSNWRKEAIATYESTDDCLFVGLRADKKDPDKFKVQSSMYDEDLNKIPSGKYRKIFMSTEAFKRIRLRSATIDQYDEYLASVDQTYRLSDSNKANEKTKSLREKLKDELMAVSSKSMGAPFFEDLGIDSIVFDEAHTYKNSRDTVEFKGAKFLSLADASGAGMDAQAKAWYVRKGNQRQDGVLCLTATPITNSPLEIYSMLSLAVGDQRMNDMMGGIAGADQFMEAMCVKESREEETIDGKMKDYDVFVGLANVDLLRNVMSTCMTARTADQVGEQIVAPDADEAMTHIEVSEATNALLIEYKQAFRYAIDELSGKKGEEKNRPAYERVEAKLGEPMELIGHPFNLMRKMTALILDPELDERATVWTIADKARAEGVIAKWNAKPPVEIRPRETPHTAPGSVVGTKTVKDGEDKVELLKIEVRAKLAGTRLILDTLDTELQMRFEDMADAAGLDLTCSVPPKLAAMLDNFQKEEANPRGMIDGKRTARVRQLIFCDTLALHTKIRRLLVQRAGVPASAIAIVTGTINGKPEEILAVQDGFNAEDEGHKYRVVIANEKCEVGINLQKGTQAIHHLTLGWTPDSLTQRNGRGVRQGNETEVVRVYHYDASGTYDSTKRTFVGNKATWIDEVMSPDGANTIEIATGLTREQQIAMIERVGLGGDALAQWEQERAVAEQMARAASTQERQHIAADTAIKKVEELKANAKPLHWLADRLGDYIRLRDRAAMLRARADSKTAGAAYVAKYATLAAADEASLGALRDRLNEAITFRDHNGSVDRSGIDGLIKYAANWMKRGNREEQYVPEQIRKGRIDEKRITVNEGAEILADYRSEMDFAQSMIDSAIDDFKRSAKLTGGLPADMADKIAKGRAVFLGGKLYVEGTIVEFADGIGATFVREEWGSIAMSVSKIVAGRLRADSLANAVDMRQATFHPPGSAGYLAACERCAQAQDALGAVDADRVHMLPSNVSADVAQRLAAPVTIKVDCYMNGLSSPHFPCIVPQDAPDEATVVRHIAQQQAAVVLSTLFDGGGETRRYYDLEAVLPAGTPLSRTPDAPWSALIAYAKAHGLKLKAADVKELSRYGDVSLRVLTDLLPQYHAASGYTSVSTVEELDAATMRWIREDIGEVIDVAAIGALDAPDARAALLGVNSSSVTFYDAALARLKREAERAAAPAPAAADPAPQSSVGAPTLDVAAVAVDGIVGVKGDTRPIKERLKENGGFRWDGVAEQWNLTVDAWTKFAANYPEAIRRFNLMLVPPSKVVPR